MTSKNIIDKIWEAHVVESQKDAPDILFIDLQLIHEVTSPQAFDVLREKNLPLLYPERHFGTIDHSIPTDACRSCYIDEQARKQVEKFRENCREFGVKFFDCDSGSQGIVHVIGPELGLTQPGKTIVCGDSHTSTHGAFGALAFGIGTSQVSHVMATQSLLLEKPKTMKVEFKGKPTKYFSAKDAILLLIYQIGIEGGTGHAIEFCGEYIRNLSMDERMTICNMAIECGAKSGLIAPDEITFDYLKSREFSPKNFKEKCKDWLNFQSDENAKYDTEIVVDLTNQKPRITWGTCPEQSIQIDEEIPKPTDFLDKAKCEACENALEYTKLKSFSTADVPRENFIGKKIDYVFIGSCTNSRITDLRIAAEIFREKKVAKNVRCLVVPGSEKVYAQCKTEGLDKIFVQAGCDYRLPGCSMCLAMNGDEVPVGKRCISTSNRNFVGRQGKGSFTHLVSPLVAAIAAVEGQVVDPEKFFE